MPCQQDQPGLASKPSVAFSTKSSAAASATSAATTRSGGSRLLFGEIDTSSDRSSESYASVCSFVLCDSSTFLKFWLEDKCRDCFLSHVAREDLASLRLTCHDFSVRAAPALFQNLNITFRSNTFTRPARLAALDRLGFYVQSLTFNLPHSPDTFLPPLVDPETGAELSFTYTPQIEASTSRRPKYGDMGTTEILTRQWPALFHAATNVPAFVRVFSSFINLSHITLSCPGYDASQRYRRSVVDFALISLRIAIERNNLNALESLTLAPIHPGGLLYLLPLPGYGATPRSARRWSRIKHLSLAVNTPLPGRNQGVGEADHFKILQIFLRNFQSNLTTLRFRWIGGKGPIPIHQARPQANLNVASACTDGIVPHPSQRTEGVTSGNASIAADQTRNSPSLSFPSLQRAEFANAHARAADVHAFATAHKRTLVDLNLDDARLTHGSWEQALAPLTAMDRARKQRQHQQGEMAEIPIMFAPAPAVGITTTATLTAPSTGARKAEGLTMFPAPMERVDGLAHHSGRKNVRFARWLPSSKCKAQAVRRVREGFMEVLRGGRALAATRT